MTQVFHQPVMLPEVVKLLKPQPGKVFIDATIGGGGHASALLNKGAKVLGIDHDQDSINHLSVNLKTNPNLTLDRANFKDLTTIAVRHQVRRANGILFDLGVSSHQLDSPDRGFSLYQNSLLDMRMDHRLAVTARDLIAALGVRELAKLFKNYSDEPRAKAIANAIVAHRKQRQIATTGELAELIDRHHRGPRQKIHPATKVFQALRIAVNDELNNLKAALPQARDLLSPGGVLIIISFHSLEDKIAKNFFNTDSRLKVLTPKPLTPTQSEVDQNQRSRSARLRAASKQKI